MNKFDRCTLSWKDFVVCCCCCGFVVVDEGKKKKRCGVKRRSVETVAKRKGSERQSGKESVGAMVARRKTERFEKEEQGTVRTRILRHE